jgi:hypothetical protein
VRSALSRLLSRHAGALRPVKDRLDRILSGDFTMSTTTQQSVKGLDIGTSRIVLATLNGEDVDFNPQLNAFVDIPYSKMTEQMLSRERILHQVEGPHIYVYGNRADEFAKFLDGDTRRPMQGGLLNPAEPKNVQMIGLLLERLCGKASSGEKLCLSVPCAPVERGSDLIFHARSVQTICEKLGYEAKVINEGLAVVYSELKDANFTGIGMSFGGGMCNICLAYLGLPVLTLATTRAGDYIDHSVASVTGETPTTVRLHKEDPEGFKLNGAAAGAVDQALGVYYADVIDTAVQAMQHVIGESKKLPRFTGPIPIVCAGGTAAPKGFLPLLKQAIEGVRLPFAISGVTLAKDPLNSTAKGALVSAMLNM